MTKAVEEKQAKEWERLEKEKKRSHPCVVNGQHDDTCGSVPDNDVRYENSLESKKIELIISFSIHDHDKHEHREEITGKKSKTLQMRRQNKLMSPIAHSSPVAKFCKKQSQTTQCLLERVHLPLGSVPLIFRLPKVLKEIGE